MIRCRLDLKNQVIFGSINFRQDHMEEAIRILLDSCYDEIVELIDKDEFTEDPEIGRAHV